MVNRVIYLLCYISRIQKCYKSQNHAKQWQTKPSTFKSLTNQLHISKIFHIQQPLYKQLSHISKNMPLGMKPQPPFAAFLVTIALMIMISSGFAAAVPEESDFAYTRAHENDISNYQNVKDDDTKLLMTGGKLLNDNGVTFRQISPEPMVPVPLPGSQPSACPCKCTTFCDAAVQCWHMSPRSTRCWVTTKTCSGAGNTHMCCCWFHLSKLTVVLPNSSPEGIQLTVYIAIIRKNSFICIKAYETVSRSSIGI